MMPNPITLNSDSPDNQPLAAPDTLPAQTITTIDTRGGAVMQGAVNTGSSDFVDRDKIVHGDKVGGDKITFGTIENATGVAIGAGAQAIVNNVANYIQQALSAVDEAEKARLLTRQRLAEAVRDYAQRLFQLGSDEHDAAQGGPYRGLVAYTLADTEIFFGRDRALQELWERIHRNRLTILQSESGAGKSSLLQAGIAPQILIKGHLPVYIRPYDLAPSLKLKQTLFPALANVPELANSSLRDFLNEVTRSLGSSTTLYVMVDQFEEFFALISDEPTRSRFVHELAECLEDEGLNVRWVLALRSEFFGDLANFRPRIKKPFDNDYRLNRLTSDEARAVIIKPGLRHHLIIEPPLVDAILTDLKQPDGEIAPPQIQLVCLALYQAYREQVEKNDLKHPAQAQIITLALYDQEERAKGILRRYLDRVLRRTLRNQAERELARRLLVELISSDQRRLRLSQSELAKRLATAMLASQSLDPKFLDTVLKELVDSNLLITDKRDEDEETTYELAHDYLLGEIQVDPVIQTRKAAQELLQREVESYRHFKTLLSKEKFDIINSQRALLVMNETAEQLLKQSEDIILKQQRDEEAARQRQLAEAQANAETERRRATTLRRFAYGFALLTLIALAATGFAFVQRREAEQKAEIAFVRQLLAQADLAYEENPLLGLRLALEADAHLTQEDEQIRTQIKRSIERYTKQGRIAKLSDSAAGILDVPGTSWLIIQKDDSDMPDELRNMADGSLLLTLTGSVDTIDLVSDASSFFVVDYADSPGELRNEVDGSLLLTLTGSVDTIDLVSDASSFFVVDYNNSRGELRNKVDGSHVLTLTGEVVNIDPVSDASSFFGVDYVDYGDPPRAELRNKADGSPVTESGIVSVWNNQNATPGYFFILNSKNRHTELWQHMPLRPLIDLDIGIAWEPNNEPLNAIHFDQEQQTLAIKYEDGRTYPLDLAWLLDVHDKDLVGEERMTTVCLPFATRAFAMAERQKSEFLGDLPSLACPDELQLIAQGRVAARANDVSSAIAYFEQAKTLSPTLAIEPATEAKRLATEALVTAGRNLYLQGNLDGALNKLAEAKARNPQVAVAADVQTIARQLLRQGKALLRAGEVMSATAKFTTLIAIEEKFGAGTLPNTLAIEVKRQYASAVVIKANNLARSGEITKAVAAYHEALVLDPTQVITPAVEAKRQYAPAVVIKANDLARSGEIAASLAAISQALQLDPNVSIQPATWSSICWHGSLYGLASRVLFACEKAVAAAPDDGSARNGRGLALALRGDTNGAIADFKVCATVADPMVASMGGDPNLLWCEMWVKRLEAGEDPQTIFSRQTLDALRTGQAPPAVAATPTPVAPISPQSPSVSAPLSPLTTPRATTPASPLPTPVATTTKTR